MPETPAPMLRFFCVTDDQTPVGKVAVAFADAFDTIGLPFRVVSIGPMSTTGVMGSGVWSQRWRAHGERFLTPIMGTYTNIVCGTGHDWKNLYTVGVRNVLITGDPPDLHKEHVAMALRYEALIVTSNELGDRWRLVGGHPLVIPLEGLAAASQLRAALA